MPATLTAPTVSCARHRRAALQQAQDALARLRVPRPELHRCDGCGCATTNAPVEIGWNTPEGREDDWLVACDECREAGEREAREALGLA